MNKENSVFQRSNYIILIIGVVIVAVGFLLMMGGGSPDPKVFNADELFSTRRITVAPMLVLSGFVVVLYSIMKKPKEEKQG
jgi:hypothetical protein